MDDQSLPLGPSGWTRDGPAPCMAPGQLSTGLPHVQSLCPKPTRAAARAGRTLLPLCAPPDTPPSPLKPCISRCSPCSQQPQNLGDLSAVRCLQSSRCPRCHPGRPAILGRDYCSLVWSPARRPTQWEGQDLALSVNSPPCLPLQAFSKFSHGYFVLVLAAVLLRVQMLPVSSEAALSTGHWGMFCTSKNTHCTLACTHPPEDSKLFTNTKLSRQVQCPRPQNAKSRKSIQSRLSETAPAC